MLFLRSVFLAALLMVSLPVALSAKDRVALVLGNSDYAHLGYLPNAAQDAQDVSDALRALEFEVFEGIDLTRKQIGRLVLRVMSRLDEDDLALFYYAGHGIQFGSQNYILPVDASGTTEEKVQKSAIRLQSIIEDIEQRASRNVVIMDACRDNPFAQGLDEPLQSMAATGLAELKGGLSTFIAFATEPGMAASDGAGRNSPFTGALLRYINDEEKDVHELMRKVRIDVVEATNNAQTPWESSSLLKKICLAQPGGHCAQPVSLPTPTPQPEVTAPVQPQPQRPDLVLTHAVSGLDPNGDGFLALRAGTYTGAVRLAKMTEGTRLQFLGQDGVWFHVRTETGLEGWAHSNWIRFTGAQTAAAQTTCEALWQQRNAYFHRRGYCFQSARGQAAFSNQNCIPGLSAANVPLSSAERAAVSQIKAQERAMGCP